MIQVKIFNHESNIINIEDKINKFFSENDIKEILGLCGTCIGNAMYIICMYRVP